MASNEDMVPKDRPYGERQKTESAMKLAGVPASSASGGSGPPTALNATSPVVPAPPAPVNMSSYDVFANREPTPEYQPAPSRQVMYEKVRQSPNAVMQGIYERMAGYKEG